MARITPRLRIVWRISDLIQRRPELAALREEFTHDPDCRSLESFEARNMAFLAHVIAMGDLTTDERAEVESIKAAIMALISPSS